VGAAGCGVGDLGDRDGVYDHVELAVPTVVQPVTVLLARGRIVWGCAGVAVAADGGQVGP